MNTVHSRLDVGGMNCASCARHVESALAELDGVSARVDLSTMSATVAHPADVTVGELIAIIEDAGYSVEPGGSAAAS